MLLTSAVFTLVLEEFVFITLGFLALQGRVHPTEAILAATLGLISADALTVWFGRHLGFKVIHRKPFCFFFGQKAVYRSLERLRTSGIAVLFFARFIPMFRGPVFLAAGISGISLRRSISIDIGAASLQISLFFGLGYVFGDRVSRFIPMFALAVPAGVVFILLLGLMRYMCGSRPFT